MSDFIPHQALLRDIEEFCRRNGLTKTAFGAKALNDPSFIKGLEGGRECRSRTLARVHTFMKSHRAPASEGAA